MYVENGWLSLNPIYLSLLHSHKLSDNFSDMRAQGVLSYHLIKVPWCLGIKMVTSAGAY